MAFSLANSPNTLSSYVVLALVTQKFRNWSKTITVGKLDSFPLANFRITTEDSLNLKYDTKRTQISTALLQKLEELLSSKREEKEKLSIQLNEQFAAAKKAIDEQASELVQDYQAKVSENKREIESILNQIDEVKKSTVRKMCERCWDEGRWQAELRRAQDKLDRENSLQAKVQNEHDKEGEEQHLRTTIMGMEEQITTRTQRIGGMEAEIKEMERRKAEEDDRSRKLQEELKGIKRSYDEMCSSSSSAEKRIRDEHEKQHAQLRENLEKITGKKGIEGLQRRQEQLLASLTSFLQQSQGPLSPPSCATDKSSAANSSELSVMTQMLSKRFRSSSSKVSASSVPGGWDLSCLLMSRRTPSPPVRSESKRRQGL
eukprot:755208-Hanusia_phi.AAC.1